MFFTSILGRKLRRVKRRWERRNTSHHNTPLLIDISARLTYTTHKVMILKRKRCEIEDIEQFEDDDLHLDMDSHYYSLVDSSSLEVMDELSVEIYGRSQSSENSDEIIYRETKKRSIDINIEEPSIPTPHNSPIRYLKKETTEIEPTTMTRTMDDIMNNGIVPTKLYSKLETNNDLTRVDTVFLSDEAIDDSKGDRVVIGHLLFKKEDLSYQLYPSKELNQYCPTYVSKKCAVDRYNSIGLSEIICDIIVDHEIGIVDVMFEVSRYNLDLTQAYKNERGKHQAIDPLTQFASCLECIDRVDKVMQNLNDLTRPMALAFEIDRVDTRRALNRKFMMELEAYF